ncbi:MAG: hypothetical protein ICV79_17590 [Flavisolibacter sp.]|nr:hypothetical protein [Flavisolibacter sp.]
MRNRTLAAKVLLLFVCTVALYHYTNAQGCESLNVSYSTAESRCVSTGSITVSVSGGSGSYNYKAIGPVTTPFTSSNVITGLQPGSYSIIVKDIISNCETTVSGAVIPGSYSDPRFQLTHTNVTCAGNDGIISVSNQQYGRAPFSYSIIAPSASNVGVVSATG